MTEQNIYCITSMKLVVLGGMWYEEDKGNSQLLEKLSTFKNWLGFYDYQCLKAT